MTDIAANTEAEVVDAVRAAREWKSPLNIMGARTKRNLGREVASWGMVLDLSGLNEIVSYEPDELTITVKPGTSVAEIEAVLAHKNQRLGFEPADWGPLLGAPANKGTIGGAIAADVSGSAAVRYGRARDSLLGIRAVNGLGEAYKAGGKVVKNVTGFDLPKLMCGAMGTLGPLTEITLRVFPKAPLSKTMVVVGGRTVDEFALLRQIWSSPLEATALCHLPSGAADPFPALERALQGAVLVRLEGAAEPLADKVSALRAMCGTSEMFELKDGDSLLRFIASGAVYTNWNLDIWRIAVPPSHAERCVRDLRSDWWTADWAGGLLWAATQPNDASAVKNVRAAMQTWSGNATLIRPANAQLRNHTFQPLPENLMALTCSVKAAFDPLGLFNPGRMYEGV